MLVCLWGIYVMPSESKVLRELAKYGSIVVLFADKGQLTASHTRIPRWTCFTSFVIGMPRLPFYWTCAYKVNPLQAGPLSCMAYQKYVNPRFHLGPLYPFVITYIPVWSLQIYDKIVVTSCEPVRLTCKGLCAVHFNSVTCTMNTVTCTFSLFPDMHWVIRRESCVFGCGLTIYLPTSQLELTWPSICPKQTTNWPILARSNHLEY